MHVLPEQWKIQRERATWKSGTRAKAITQSNNLGLNSLASHGRGDWGEEGTMHVDK